MGTLIYLIVSIANVYSTIIFVYVLMSWLPVQNYRVLSEIYDFLGKICDPYLNLFRKFIPPIGGIMDVSPIVALLVLQFGVRLLVRLF